MILEGLVTTCNAEGAIHLRPMGPWFASPAADEFLLRPYEPSRTLDNLLATRQGVLHVVDDVLLIARAALDRLQEIPATRPAEVIDGVVLVEACHWMEFIVEQHRALDPRHELECRIVARGRVRDFWGFNRAKHAVLEATILATRLTILDAESIREAMRMLWSPVQKTAGPQERLAWNLVREIIVEHLGERDLPPSFSPDPKLLTPSAKPGNEPNR